jgi:hypothetical protein
MVCADFHHLTARYPSHTIAVCHYLLEGVAMDSRRVFLAAWVVFVCASSTASAQAIGTFVWQTQPYCNRVAVTVIQVGGMFQLTGVDDLCGAGAAPATGTAVVQGSGVAMGLTVALPSGRAAHITANVSLATVSGTWSDADGTSGPFVFNASGGSTPRPAPMASVLISASQLSPTIFAGSGSATTLARSDHDHDARYYTQAQIDTTKTATAVTTPILGGPSSPYTFVPEGVIASLTQTVTTDRAGRLQVTKMYAGSPACSTPGESLIFLVVDGVAVRSSAVFHPSGAGQLTTRLTGVTDAVLPAGAHTVAIAGECPGASTFSAGSTFLISNTGVVVLPQ